jgi:RNase P subunit RPR2
MGNPAKRKTCPDCKTVFEYLEEDIKVHHDYGGGSDNVVICPVCKERIYI